MVKSNIKDVSCFSHSLKKRIFIYIDGANFYYGLKTILISGDGDFTQLVNYVKKEDKEVEIYTFKELTSVDLINKANKHFWIDKKTVNKFFWRKKD